MSKKQSNVWSDRMLLADWFMHLVRQSGLDLSGVGTNKQAFTLGPIDGFHVTADFIASPPFLKFIASDTSLQATVDSIVQSAMDHVERGDTGGTVWYSAALQEEEENKISPAFMGSIFERLGSQTRIQGWRRLGSDVLLEFTETLPPDWNEASFLFVPKAEVHVHIASSGPCAGLFSEKIAGSIIETIAAICTFALGRSLSLFPVIDPAESEFAQQLETRRTDSRIGTLARKGVSLDIFSPLAVPGGLDVFSHARAALQSFDAAVRQERDTIACILYVVAAESLTTPYSQKWRHSKLTNRFKEFFDELMPTELNAIVRHHNFEEAFGIRRGNRTDQRLREKLLEYIYDFRSGQLHEGIEYDYSGFGAGIDTRNDMRRSLFSDFAEGAILHYLASPRGSLIGHPAFDRPSEAASSLEPTSSRWART